MVYVEKCPQAPPSPSFYGITPIGIAFAWQMYFVLQQKHWFNKALKHTVYLEHVGDYIPL